MTVKTHIAIVAAGAALLGGCGTQTAGDAARSQATDAQKQAEQTASNLSPKAQSLLQDAEGLAGDVGTTAKGYQSGDLSRPEATDALSGFQKRASELAQRAQDLPTTEKARGQLGALTDKLSATTGSLRSDLDQGAAKDSVQGTVDELRSSASTTYDQLKGRIPSDARTVVDEALSVLGG